jgi:malate dehydrogenase (oxaloacetate-decarboxylating)
MSKQAIRVALRGDALLHSPRWNKGSAFTAAERRAFNLVGRLPAQVNNLDEQCKRAYDQLESHASPISKNAFLQSLRDQVRAPPTARC